MNHRRIISRRFSCPPGLELPCRNPHTNQSDSPVTRTGRTVVFPPPFRCQIQSDLDGSQEELQVSKTRSYACRLLLRLAQEEASSVLPTTRSATSCREITTNARESPHNVAVQPIRVRSPGTCLADYFHETRDVVT